MKLQGVPRNNYLPTVVWQPVFYQRSKHVKIKILFFSATTTECYDCTSKTLFSKENIEIEKSLYRDSTGFAHLVIRLQWRPTNYLNANIDKEMK